MCLWLPKKYRKPNSSEYVQGVEVSLDYDGEIPEGFEVIDLPKAKYLMFQGEPFAEEDYCEAIEMVQSQWINMIHQLLDIAGMMKILEFN